MTIHYLLPQLPPHLREPIISLLDVVFANLMLDQRKHLLICSSGTRKLELFQQHDLWPLVETHVLLPDEEDQNRIHQQLIYPIKKNPKLSTLFPLLELLLDKYEVDSFIVGCSEMHLLAKLFVSPANPRNSYCCIDPLAIIARELHQTVPLQTTKLG
jgi:aspartate racemase